MLVVTTIVMAFVAAFFYFQIQASLRSTYIPPLEETKTTEIRTDQTNISGAEVTITDSGFSPTTITIAAGQQVTFTNRDQSTHRVIPYPAVVRDRLPQLDSDDLQPTDSFTYTFEKSGNFSLSDYMNLGKYVVTVIVY